MEKRQVRSSNIELVRILMMLSLVAHHSALNSGVVERFTFDDITFNMVFMQIVSVWGKTAINVFTLISGYYMVTKDLTLKKFLKLYLEVKFYYVAIFVFFVAIGYQEFSTTVLLKEVIFNVIYETNTLYTGSMIVMYLCVPFMNVLARNLTKRQYQGLMAFIMGYFTIFPMVFKIETFQFAFWLMAVYLIGGYIRLHPMKIDNLKFGICFMLLSISLLIGRVIVIDFWISKYKEYSPYFYTENANKLLPVIVALGIFITFKNLKMPNIRWINVIASSTFGVLLIHANSWSMRRFLWIDGFKTVQHFYADNFWLYEPVTVVLVFAVAVLIDQLRIILLEKPLFRWLEKKGILK